MGGVHVLIPAAGAARRMRGGDKLLESVDGVPQLRRAVEAARGGGARRVWVTVQPDDEARRAVLRGTLAKPIEVPDWAEGMSASLRAGARAAGAQRAAALMVLLPDLPEIASTDVAKLIATHAGDPGAIWRAAAEDGTPGHPVLIPSRLYPALAGLTGDAGARDLLAGEEVRMIALEGQRATTDLDTPEAWAAWRARTGRVG